MPEANLSGIDDVESNIDDQIRNIQNIQGKLNDTSALLNVGNAECVEKLSFCIETLDLAKINLEVCKKLNGKFI